MDSSSRVGSDALGSHAVQPARMLSMSLAGTIATASGLTTGSFAFLGAAPDPFLRYLFLSSYSSSEM